MENNNFTCDFCDKTFVREKNYLKHKCEQMKRYEVFNKPIGHLAYLTFNQWRKLSGLPPIDAEDFVKSKYFNAFKKFATFSRTQSIPDKIGYIELMISRGLQPFMWCDYDVYDFYLENFDKNYTIEKKIDISISTLKDISEVVECDISKVFDNLEPIDVLKMITSRRLSPWLLLLSKKFMDFITYKTDKSERMLFNNFIDVKKWKQYFLEKPEKVAYIKSLLKDLDL